MLDKLQTFLTSDDVLTNTVGGVLAAAILGVVAYLWKRATHKQPVFAGDIYDLKFPDTDNGALVGRETELADLTAAWRSPDIRVLALVAWAGIGKTALVNAWREAIKCSEQEALSPKRIYAWSFQNQGIANAQTSSGAFFDHALRWFKSDRDKFDSEHDKGVYLAKLVNTQRTLLILDGLEVFQPHMTGELQGEVNDKAMLGLLQTLAKENPGLCLISTRQALAEQLTRHRGVRNQPLENLPIPAAVQLLQKAGVKGKREELEAVARDYQGHAYSLTLLANYLRQFCKGDIRRRDTLPTLADESRPEGWQAQQLLFGYADALEGREELGLMYVASLFDKGVDKQVILEVAKRLQEGGYQTALNKLNIVRLDEPQRWVAAFRYLQKLGLLLGDNPEWLDMHPLVRDFFRREFQFRYEGIKRRIHIKLYEYYKALPEKELPDTLEEMQPLFSAVAHGCAAGLHQQVLDEVFWPRISREGDYVVSKLGAFSDDLATVAHFFTTPWHTPAAALGDAEQAGVLNWAGFGLRALGRLREALEPMQANIEMNVKRQSWKDAAVNASNLSELELTLGEVAAARESGQRSVDYADQSGDMFSRMGYRTTHADALHQAGEAEAALALFREAEQLQQEWQSRYPRLYALQGFRYCDLLLAQGGTAEVLEWAEQTLEWANQNRLSLLTVALDQLTLGRAHLQQAVEETPPNLPLSGEGQEQAAHWLDQAVAGLRAAGQQIMLPRGLLARAALHRHSGDFARARQDLWEVFEIAEPSGMRLFLTDWHLEVARLLLEENPPRSPFFKGGDHSANTPKTDRRVLPFEKGETEGISYHIREAARLIAATGYHRRDPELAELQQQL
jgi:tetratricopeptide (TPR) repeat protein